MQGHHVLEPRQPRVRAKPPLKCPLTAWAEPCTGWGQGAGPRYRTGEERQQDDPRGQVGRRGLKRIWQLSRSNSACLCEGAGEAESQAEEEAWATSWPVGRCGSSPRGADSPGEEWSALLGWQLVSSGKEPDIRAAPALDLICPLPPEAAAGLRGLPGIPHQLGSRSWGLLPLEGRIQATVSDRLWIHHASSSGSPPVSQQPLS